MDDSGRPEDVRLRRFALAVGAIFLIYTCGGASFESETVSLIWLGELTLENFIIIKLMIYGVAAYACGIFIYRECFLKDPPFRVRGWFRKYGVIVDFSKDPNVTKRRDAQRDLEFMQRRKNSSFPLEEIFLKVPYSYLNDLMVSVDENYLKEDRAIMGQVRHRKLERYFPFIREDNLAITGPNDAYGHKKVSIEKLDLKTTLFAYLEDFIFILPVVPYVVSIFCLLPSLWSYLKTFT